MTTLLLILVEESTDEILKTMEAHYFPCLLGIGVYLCGQIRMFEVGENSSIIAPVALKHARFSFNFYFQGQEPQQPSDMSKHCAGKHF